MIGDEQILRETADTSKQEKIFAKSVELLPIIRRVARECGYAIGVHGSFRRDLDIIAAPWMENVKTPTELAEAISAAIGGYIPNDGDARPGNYTKRSPQPLPHGRQAWSIHVSFTYIDLSVMPIANETFEALKREHRQHEDSYVEQLATARETIRQREEDLTDSERIREKMRDILTATANALKGDPGDLKMHDWSDLPKLVREQAQEIERQEERVQMFAALHLAVEERERIALQHITALERRVRELEAAQRWVSIEERLPESGVPVIAAVRNSHDKLRRIRAQYAAPKTLEVGDEAAVDFGEYDEESDTYYCPQGWYETNEYEETHWAVDGRVTHWMPLPVSPLPEVPR